MNVAFHPDDAMKNVFVSHGESKVHIEGRLLISEVTGPFNMELAKEWTDMVSPHAEKFRVGGPAAGVTIYKRSCLTQPDVVKYLKSALKFGAEKENFVAYALVIAHDVEGALLADHIYKPAYSAYADYALFNEVEEAKAWANQAIARHVSRQLEA